jgi:hypothetical protein
MDKTKAYSKVSRQLTAILKGMDDWEDLKVFQKSIAMTRSAEFQAVHKRVIGTKRWKEYTERFQTRWPAISSIDSKEPYPEAFLDAQKEWYEKNEKNEQLRENKVKRLEDQRKKLKKAKRLK